MPHINLGTAANFAVLAGVDVTNTGPTVITGCDVGVSPGNSITGFPPGIIVMGTMEAGNPVASAAQNDLTIAYNTAVATPCTQDLTGQDLGGLVLTAGVYCFSSSAQLTGVLTLDGQGDPNAEFIFKIGTTLTTASGSSVLLINDAQSENVFFQVGTSATLGTGTQFFGNILALTSITSNTGTTVTGRLLARNGSVTLDTNEIACMDDCPVITLSPSSGNPTILPNGTVLTPYGPVDIDATGGQGPYSFNISLGSLPTGITLNPATGIISGVPVNAGIGTFIFTITATDVNGCMGSQSYSITIGSTPPVPPRKKKRRKGAGVPSSICVQKYCYDEYNRIVPCDGRNTNFAPCQLPNIPAPRGMVYEKYAEDDRTCCFNLRPINFNNL